MIQAKRATTMTVATPAAGTARDKGGIPASCNRCTTPRNARPISTKMRDSSRNTATFQTALASVRVFAGRPSCCFQPTTKPHATVDSTPDTWSRSPPT